MEYPTETLFQGILKDKLHKRIIELIAEGKINEEILDELLKEL